MRVLALATHPEGGASTRHRIAQFLPRLKQRGVDVDLRPLLTPPAFARLYRKGAVAGKTLDWLGAWSRRWSVAGGAGRYDLVLLLREVWPLRGLLIEQRLLERNGRWLFDLDDAVYLPHVSEANRRIGFLKDAGKADWIARHSRAVSAGNGFIESWAAERLPPPGRVFRVPTAVDTERWIPADGAATAAGPRSPVLGWIGSHSTVSYLDPLRPALRALAARHPGLTLRVIGAEFRETGLDVETVPWSLDREVEALQGIDIGLAPLPDTEWARGKCGLKLLQYLALAKSAVASAIGAHLDIVADGGNALFARTTEQWTEAVSRLIQDGRLRRSLGEAGRRTVEDRYSVRAVAPLLHEAMEYAASGR